MEKRRTLFLVYDSFYTFVKADFEFLKNDFNVIRYQHRAHKKFLPFFVEILRVCLFLIKNIRRIDIIYSWFCDYHTFLPVLFSKIFKRKSVIIVGGYDAVSISVIKYGIFYKNNLRALLAKLSYIMCDHIVAVDSSLVRGWHSFFTDENIPTGITFFVRKIERKSQVVPTGYDCKKWQKFSQIKKERMVLSVSAASDMIQFRRKGLDFLIEIAIELPEVPFIIIGLMDEALDHAQEITPGNVEILEYVANNELIAYYSRSKVFCLLSLNEGLPNALCEAMLCECIPVGSNVNGIPFAIGECGFVLKKKKKRSAKALIQLALNADPQLGLLARERIIKKFPLQSRRKAILKILREAG